MTKLYQKNELCFSIIWIVVYVVGASITDALSVMLGIEKIATLPFLLLLSIHAAVWVKKNGLEAKYGLCMPSSPASRFLYYIPLMIVITCNLWYGTALNFSLLETVLYIGSMFCVGFFEELIFRGFLFKAMCKDSVKAAIIVSSVTFGIGHIVNLFNGSGADVVSNLCQIISAIAFGFLFVTIFHREGSLIPCIVTHSLLNALSAFSNQSSVTMAKEILISAILTVIALIYTLVLLKTLPKPNSEQ